MTTEEKCENCKYIQLGPNDDLGRCVRYPPTPVVMVCSNRDGEADGYVDYFFPVVNIGGFCGEFKEKKV